MISIDLFFAEEEGDLTPCAKCKNIMVEKTYVIVYQLDDTFVESSRLCEECFERNFGDKQPKM